MITYKGSDVQYSWEEESDEVGGPDLPICAYIKEGNATVDGPEPDYDMILKRWRRDLSMERRSAIVRPQKTRCPLLLVADYRFYREMGGSSNKSTINYLISLIDRVTKIYEETQWKEKADDSGFDGMGFVIKKIVVHSEPTVTQHGEMHYNMHMEKWDVRTLLEVFSREYTHKDFCLAHLFTDIKFEGGILGLAYVGSPRRNSVGGICTPGTCRRIQVES
jgi:disintegrin and metalloproteinase domain-containing protein 17